MRPLRCRRSEKGGDDWIAAREEARLGQSMALAQWLASSSGMAIVLVRAVSASTDIIVVGTDEGRAASDGSREANLQRPFSGRPRTTLSRRS